MTKHVPWAAYIQDESGAGYTLEQQELHRTLAKQRVDNPHKTDLGEAIDSMNREAGIRIHVDTENTAMR